ncbi:MAG: zinc-dependent metalloprotease [Gemmatimonadota bacterium]
MVQRMMGATWMLALVVGLAPLCVGAQQEDELPSIAEKTEGMTQVDGFMPMYWDERAGTLWLEIGRWDEELLHYTSLPAGLGQNDLGLNRGDLGGRHVVVFRRVGPKILMEEPNYGFRATSDDPLERRSVDDGFPTSVLWGFTAAAETGERVLVDATGFLLRDWNGVVTTLEPSQGSWSLDLSRSAVYMPRTKGFPTNTEIEVTLTFTSNNPGGLVRSVTPTGNALTVRQHHSFVELPALDGSFQPRRADPRAGYGGPTYMDFARPIEEDLEVRYIARHRLHKQNPGADPSAPVEPIVYYLDPGTPEPVRTALLEGGAWWNEAFEAAGYVDGFRMEILPDTADPMDARYNVIQWVHRSTRGWSYGNSVQDPRTGEILKGHVTLGSLRVRQDYLIGEGLTSPYLTGDESPADVREMALQRIRQLSAHEIGHTLGLSHNFISSAHAESGTTSVMDYPHPISRLEGGSVTLGRESYPDEIGAWDKIAIRYGYTDFPAGTDERAALEDILLEGMQDGIIFVSDVNAGSAHPNVHQWDNGGSAAGELERMMDVRRVALDNFGETAIPFGEPMATMEEAFVPLYLHHRYQTEAASKVVAGQYYTYALRGDGQTPVRAVPAAEQQRALNALMRTLSPEELAIPERVLESLPPRPARYGGSQELFERHTGLVFDAIAPARAAAEATLGVLFHPQRAARMIQQRALDNTLPGLEQVIGQVREATFGSQPAGAYQAEIGRTVERAFVERLIALAAEAPMAQVRAVASYQLEEITVEVAEASATANPADRAHYLALAGDVARFLERPYAPVAVPSAPDMPPGSPIGDPGMHWVDLSCPWGP